MVFSVQLLYGKYTPCLRITTLLWLANFDITSNNFDNFCSHVILYFSITSASALPGETKPKTASFHLNAECCFDNRHTKHIHIITWSQMNHPSFSQESTICTKHDLWKEYIFCKFCYHTFIVYQVCRDVVCCVNSGSCSLSSLKWKVNRQYWWDILLFQQISNRLSMTILFAFQQHSSCMHSAWCEQHSSTAAVQNSQLHFSWGMAQTGQSWTQLITRFRESIGAWIWVASLQIWRNQAATGCNLKSSNTTLLSEKVRF